MEDEEAFIYPMAVSSFKLYFLSFAIP
jgi:hypothetical protein